MSLISVTAFRLTGRTIDVAYVRCMLILAILTMASAAACGAEAAAANDDQQEERAEKRAWASVHQRQHPDKTPGAAACVALRVRAAPAPTAGAPKPSKGKE